MNWANRSLLAAALSAISSVALAAATQTATISSTTFTNLGAAPVAVQTLSQAVNVCVADSTPTAATACHPLYPGPFQVFNAADSSSHVWASILGGTTTIAYTPVYSSSIGSVTQGTSPWVDDLTQWASVALGAPSNFGTSPGAVEVPGVNAYVFNASGVPLYVGAVASSFADGWDLSTQLTTAAASCASGAGVNPCLKQIDAAIKSAIPTQAPTVSIGGVGIVDSAGTNVATVKAASTLPAATDKTLVVGLNPGTATAGNPTGAIVTVQGVSGGQAFPTIGSYFNNVASSTLTRAPDTTQYTANTTVCLAKTVTACVPITAAIASTNAGNGLITRVSLLKSGTATTSANFTIWMFSAAPTLTTPTQYDNVAYIGPRAADMPNYIGNAVCASPVATSDTTAGVWYDCTLSNPNTAGALVFKALSGQTYIDMLVTVNATYTPAANSETFIAYLSGIY